MRTVAYACVNRLMNELAMPRCRMSRRVVVQRSPGCTDRAEQHRAQRQVLVRVVKHDQRIVAAQFEDGPPATLADRGRDLFTECGRASGLDQWRVRIIEQCGAD